MDDLVHAPEIDPENAAAREPQPWFITSGVVIAVGGVPLKLVNVNRGKRRLTFTPLPGWSMPDEDPPPERFRRRG